MLSENFMTRIIAGRIHILIGKILGKDSADVAPVLKMD
jgi:hypothetical protein